MPSVLPPLLSRRVHLDTLTSIRFFAASWVVGYHLQDQNLIGQIPGLSTVLIKGPLGVTLFFVLSGFILTFTYADRLRNGKYSHRSFLLARTARVYPVYLVTLLIGGIQQIFFPGKDTSLALQTNPFEIIAAHLLLVQNWFLPAVTAINPPGWSISVEAAFYLLFPVLAWFSFRIPERRLIASIALVILLGFVFEIFLANGVAQHYFAQDGQYRILRRTLYAADFVPLARYDEFILGILGFRLTTSSSAGAKSYVRETLVFATLIVTILVLAAVSLSAQKLPGTSLSVYVPSPQGTLAPVVFLLLIVALVRSGGERPRWLAHPALVYGGKISFSLYLVHMPIIYVGEALPDGGSSVVRGLITFVSVIVALGAACLLFHGVEEPARQWILGAGRRADPAPFPAAP